MVSIEFGIGEKMIILGFQNISRMEMCWKFFLLLEYCSTLNSETGAFYGIEIGDPEGLQRCFEANSAVTPQVFRVATQGVRVAEPGTEKFQKLRKFIT